MLLRRSVASLRGLALQSEPWRLALRASASTGPTERRPEPGDADALLAYWRGLLDDDRQRHAGGGAADVLPLSDEDVRQLLQTVLLVRGDRVQSALPEQLTALFARYYRQLGDRQDRVALLASVAASFGVQAAAVDAAAATWQQLRRHQGAAAAAAAAAPGNVSAPGQDPLHKAAAQLCEAASPLYARLFVPLSQQAGGIKLLVDMRADLLAAIQERPSGAAPLRALSDALRACLAEWFSVGLLQLRRISWEASSAELLEKVAAGEAVHAFASWRDLKGRLDPRSRRVYAFFHQAMPGEPVVVLHTALTAGVARSMDQLLPPAAREPALLHVAGQHHAHRPPSDRTWEPEPAAGRRSWGGGGGVHPAEGQPPTAAVFYSISATQPGLAGVDLGNFLIKQVAHEVQAEFPSVTTLCTLSPMPGFASWLRLQTARAAQELPVPLPLLLPDEAAQLEAVAAGHLPVAQQAAAEQAAQHPAAAERAQQRRAAALLDWALADDAWQHSSRLEAAVQRPLLRLAAHYLLRERRRGLALDPVANFHLRNGARVLQLNWRADTSEAGLARSHGIMLNYEYQLDSLADNNRAYLVDGAIAAAPAVEALLGEAA